MINEWPTAFFSLIEKPFVKMKIYFHRQIGFQEFPKVNSDIVFISLLSCLSREKEQLHKQRRPPFSALITQPLRHRSFISSLCPSPCVLSSSSSSFPSALLPPFFLRRLQPALSLLSGASQEFPPRRVEVLQLHCVFCLLGFFCNLSGGVL